MHKAGPLRPLGSVKYNDLVESVSKHVIVPVAWYLNELRHVTDAEDPRHVTILAAEEALNAVNPELEIVAIDPKSLRACSRQISGEVGPFIKAWKQGFRFPPIIIDSGQKTGGMLHDGRHRACSAARLGIPNIEAIDLKGVNLEPLDQWLKSREF